MRIAIPPAVSASAAADADYETWCEAGKRAALSRKEFFDEFERICTEELGGFICRVGNQYVGLELADILKTLSTQRVG